MGDAGGHVEKGFEAVREAFVEAHPPQVGGAQLCVYRGGRPVVVVDDAGQPVGIITDGDVVERAAKRARPGGLRAVLDWLGGGARPEGLEVAARGRTAADVMTSPVITVTPSTPIAEAIRLMIAHRIKRLPIVDVDGRLIGLAGRAGVLAALSHR